MSSATQHAMPPEFDRKRGTGCLNTRFPLLTLLCAGYSLKLIIALKIFLKTSKLLNYLLLLLLLLLCLDADVQC